MIQSPLGHGLQPRDLIHIPSRGVIVCLMRLCCLLLAVLIVTPTLASAQCDGPYDAFLTGTYNGTAMQVRISLGHGRTWGPSICRGNAVAFHVFRRALGYQCGPEERVTDAPIAWPVSEDDVSEITCSDPGVTPNTAYRYEARAVDAEGNSAQGSGWVSGYGVAGVALLAHGELAQTDFPRMDVGECSDECFAYGLVTGSVSEWPFGSTVNLYGSNIYVLHEFNVWTTVLWVTSISPSRCVVTVESAGWSTVKQLFK